MRADKIVKNDIIWTMGKWQKVKETLTRGSKTFLYGDEFSCCMGSDYPVEVKE